MNCDIRIEKVVSCLGARHHEAQYLLKNISPIEGILKDNFSPQGAPSLIK